MKHVSLPVKLMKVQIFCWTLTRRRRMHLVEVERDLVVRVDFRHFVQHVNLVFLECKMAFTLVEGRVEAHEEGKLPVRICDAFWRLVQKKVDTGIAKYDDVGK